MTTWCRRFLHAAIAVVIATATTASNGRLVASPGQPAAAQAADISPAALAQIEALIREKAFRSEGQQKIDSQLIAEWRMEQGLPIATGVAVTATDLPYAVDGHVVVDVNARITDALMASLAALAIEVLSSDPDAGTLRVHLDIDQVEALAALPDVSFVQPQQQAQIHQAAPNVILTQTGQGSRSSQGDVTHLAYAARAAFGVNGSGIKIGVLSDGVTSLSTSQASGDLGPVMVLPGQTGSGDEGTAMLEIIHDLAPGAQLYFASAFTSITSFANNIRALRAAGCDIIVDDVAYFAETPFQDGQAANVVSNTNGGVVIQAVNDVTADGALYFSSAGNSGHLSAGTSGTWEGDFVDGGTAPSLGALTSGRLHLFGTETFTTIVKPATTAPTTLSWSDPLGGSANDYDLFRLSSDGSVVVASSTNIQSGTQDPFEQLSTPGAAGERLVIVKSNTAASRFLHLGTNRGVLSIATAGETHGHAAAAAAFDVAATPAVGPFPQPFNATNVVETFSSDGPRRVFFAANGSPYTAGNLSSSGGVLRQKPDIAAADGVSVTGAGGFPSSFFGTSAAAPHAAAIAGLLKSANPALTPAQIRTLLTTSAIDIGAAGVDRDSGAGIVMADALMRAAGVPGTALLELTSVQVSDNPGNGNGAPEAGEGGRLIIPLANYGGASATAISATLTSTTAGITITQPATRTYPDLAVSGSASAPPYFFTVASDFPCLQPASFTLTVTSAGVPSPRVFTFQVPIGPPAYTITTTLDATPPPGSPGVTTATGLQTLRLTRNGVASICGASKPPPPLFGAGESQFDAYAFATCPNSGPSCVTVTVQDASAGNLFSTAYSPTFVAGDVQQNYKADAGSSGALQTYAFSLAGGAQTFVVNVHELTPGVGIGTQYTLNVAGVCGGTCRVNHVPVAVARDVTVTAGVSGTAAVSIDNGSSDADGDPLTMTQSPPGPYPIGRTIVVLTVSDPSGATSQATAAVTVIGATTTVVSASPNPSVAAQPVAFTATVTPIGGGFPNDGTVTFQEGSTVLAGPVLLSGGHASFNTSALSVGTHTITAIYASSSGAFASSNGSIVERVSDTAATSVIGLSGSLTFGNVQVGTFATRTLTISNSGNSPLTVSSITCPNGFVASWAGTIASGGSQDVAVTFAPTSTTAYGGTIVVAANQTGGIPTTAVSGTGTSTPIAVTLAATLVTATGATLNGGVNPSGSATTARFDYGLTLGYGTQVSASPAPGSGTSLVAVSAAINGLLPNTPYHFRVVATGGASVNGSDQIFMTISSACSHSLSSTSVTTNSSPKTNSVDVTTDPGCGWTAVSNASWLTLTSGSNGNGGGTVAYSVAANNGPARTGTLTIAGQTYTVTQTARTTSPGDFNGDGKADITVFRPSTGTWFTQYSGTGTAAGVQWGNGLDVPAPGDYDGDGRTDVAIFRPSNGTWFIVYSSTDTAVGIQWGNGNDLPVPGDYDGDGKTDIAVFRPSTGTWFIVNSGTGRAVGIQWGNGNDVVVPGDYDGDGKTDIGVFRPSTGTWFIVNSSTAAAVGVQWGNGNDVVVPGDYDGDGKTDLAVFRPSNGTWFIRNSRTGTGVGLQWGNGLDVPVPGDYDGDGKTDIAVFRPSNGTWFIMYSGTGMAAAIQWGNGNDIPILKRPVI